ncbi:flagellar basal-body rod protein FlgG [Thermanaeromonas toyohensis ToBE]|uniref:Flagellar basal-body rod protein FlgG n=1 Tax=Thermanaeromonas toyohensis ToBE TaxID=698762 RepID=A0A1W1VL45_9FIRM|nr:flagellar hook-basal body complex protein [Thermanaeromonas toyohensis]SMB94105.1 flagellar basal-body rod protein FlgG [Thermanaeromonas toyohensis ToBE]
MLRALWNSASGMVAQVVHIDLLAHDLANVNTTGYKKSLPSFSDLVYRPITERGMPVERTSPPAIGAGVRLVDAAKDLAPGSLVATGDLLHLAIQGRGFLGVEGPHGELYLTRDGAFHLNERGEVIHSSGYRLLPKVTVPEGYRSVRFSPDGALVALAPNGKEEVLGQVEVYLVENPGGLEATGNNLFRPTPASGDPRPILPGPGAGVSLLPGYLEASNVDLAEALVHMLLAQRVYEVNARAARIADEMWGIANNLRR